MGGFLGWAMPQPNSVSNGPSGGFADRERCFGLSLRIQDRGYFAEQAGSILLALAGPK